MFFLKDLPSRQTLQAYQADYPAMNIDRVDTALHMLRTASLLMRELDNYFASHDLSQLRYLILVVLDREKTMNKKSEGLMASEIAGRLDVSRPVMTRTLQSLMQDGLLEAGGDSSDGRARLIRLSRAGRARLHAVLPGYYQLIDSFMQNQ
ncbi:MarR family transcriptional regulator [Undibacterium sp. TS12]|uniref:MarR family winged helix-turn-helix transcriptional regulator n=1 Tax=Undibacterium sp. TS12 TaxID=2908202 RepID=UPI001F4D0E8D|nr:MarR family transcriptional regulator [Undibacterium sp. TS12]MCH8622537.1 MarR family transcriptional regulator [Undibacterium sp. TS12]